MRILVLGASGMIGNAIFLGLNIDTGWDVFGTIRSENKNFLHPIDKYKRLLVVSDANNINVLESICLQIRPDIVINCIGLTRHVPEVNDPLMAIQTNALLPHCLAGLCKVLGARLIQISTDCVFSGKKGDYLEDDPTDAVDIYGKSKSLGEVLYPNTITLRTSTIGHELYSSYGLLEWFLSQKDVCNGYTRAMFSGLPSVILAKIIRDVIIPEAYLQGLFHISSHSIAKFDLLRLIAEIYKKPIRIVEDDSIVIDRSLNGQHFRKVTGYLAPEWPEMIKEMYFMSRRKNINYV